MKYSAADPFPRISEYGLIGNCRTAALVSNRGAIEWCCFPYFDSSSYFGAILDRRLGGSFSITPIGEFTSCQTYLAGTNVLETVFETATGSARLLDCFSVTSEKERNSGFWPANEILRVLEGTRGSVRFQLRFAPKPHYSAHPHEARHLGRMGVAYPCGHDELRFLTELDPSQVSWQDRDGTPEGTADFELRGGERVISSVIYHQTAPAIIPALGSSAMHRLERTIDYWQKWSSRCTYEGPFREQVVRSALALKLMTFAPSGAVIASPTTSLPESMGKDLNWDYRYGWLRDASFTTEAFLGLGYHEEAQAYLGWMLGTGAGMKKKYRVLYTLFGGPPTAERTLDWFRGYRDSSPVRVGNAAEAQSQLDVFGEVIEAVSVYTRRDGVRLNSEEQKFLVGMGHQILKKWNDPDDGIWEKRDQSAHYTHSKAMAWIALDRLAKLTRRMGWPEKNLADYQRVSEQIRKRIEREGYDPELGSYVQSFGSKELDSSVLVLPILGFCAADSPQMLKTIQAVRASLGREDLLYRYRPNTEPLQPQEGCFAICTFWLVEALALAGQKAEANRVFEGFLSRANPQGLWSEEIDPENGEFLGNYPQAFTHVGLIKAALTLRNCTDRKVETEVGVS
jgi:GH15 family glucan-1,4-alpha-glucosidase